MNFYNYTCSRVQKASKKGILWFLPWTNLTFGLIYICFYYIFLEISSESMATKEAAEINEEAVAPKAPIKEEDAAKALEKEEM